MNVNGRQIRLHIWDTAGQERVKFTLISITSRILDFSHQNVKNNFFQYRCILMILRDSSNTGNVFEESTHYAISIGCWDRYPLKYAPAESANAQFRQPRVDKSQQSLMIKRCFNFLNILPVANVDFPVDGHIFPIKKVFYRCWFLLITQHAKDWIPYDIGPS